jgi:hypothetical protein
LEAPHDVRRIDGLVGRDQHKLLRSDLARSLREDDRGKHVVLHGEEGVLLLHERHVLVGSRMEHDFGTIALEHLPHPAPILGVAYDRRERRRIPAVTELLSDRVKRELRGLEKHDARRRETRDLTA